MKPKLIIFAVLTALICQSLSAREYKASLFGIKSDGTTLNTGSIQKAIDYISENGGGTLVFYVGRYLTGTIQLKSNVSLRLEEGAILVGTASVYDYDTDNSDKAILVAEGQSDITISGKGVIDGQGEKLQEQIPIQIQKGFLQEPYDRACPALIAMHNCRNIRIEGINLVNACGDVQVFNVCRGVTVSGVTIKSSVSEKTTGIRILAGDSIIIRDSFIDTSGKEIFFDSVSKNVNVIRSINSKGEKL